MSQYVSDSDFQAALNLFEKAFPGEFVYSSHPGDCNKYVFQKCQFASAHAAMEYMAAEYMLRRHAELEFGPDIELSPETQDVASGPELVVE